MAVFWDYICVLCVCFVGVTLLVSIMFHAGQSVYMRLHRFRILELFNLIIKPVAIG
jgi:hypothetical protein